MNGMNTILLIRDENAPELTKKQQKNNPIIKDIKKLKNPTKEDFERIIKKHLTLAGYEVDRVVVNE
jgi:hypothetical protein